MATSIPKAAAGRRDNAYYLDRLEREAPTVFADRRAGSIASPTEAFRIAGLKRQRTRLHELKNAWTKATLADQRAFLRWLKATIPAPETATAPSSGSALAVGGLLTEEAKRNIAAILSTRKISMGEAMKEMGFSPLNGSLGTALQRGTHVRPALVHRLERWLLRIRITFGRRRIDRRCRSW